MTLDQGSQQELEQVPQEWASGWDS